MLGVGSVGGGKRTTKVFKKRLASFKKKVQKFDRLAAEGFSVRTAVRATAMPSIGYALEAAGLSNTALADVRRVVTRAAGTSTAGGNIDCELLAKDGKRGRLDPAYDAHTKPIKTMAQAWWESWRQHELLQLAFNDAVTKLRRPSTTEQNAWAKCTGPTAAAILTASRLGWHFTGPHTMISDCDEEFDFKHDSPAAIALAVEEAVTRWRTANVLANFTSTAHLLRPPPTRPPASVLPSQICNWKRAQAMKTVHAVMCSMP